MLDKVKLIEVSPGKTVTKKDLNQELNKTIFAEDQDVRDAFDADFAIDGRILALPPHLMDEYASTHLLRLDHFGIMESGPDYYTRRENYPSYLLSYTIKGSGTLEYDGKFYTLRSGDGFLIDCRKLQAYKTFGDAWVHYDLHFSGPNAEYIYDQFYQDGSAFFSSVPGGMFETRLEALLVEYQNPAVGQDFMISFKLESLLALLIEKKRESQQLDPTTQAIFRARQYMETNFHKPLRLDDLARECGLSKYYFSREFKKRTGFTPNDYLIELRITQAKALLEGTDIPAYKIGIMTGIDNVNNFNYLFKKKTGMTPGQYRSHIHENAPSG